MQTVQQINGSFLQWGPQSAAIADATTRSALSLASIDAKTATVNTDAVMFRGPQPVYFDTVPQVWGDMGRTWTLAAARDSVAVSGAVQVPGVAQESGGNLDAMTAQLAALNSNVVALNAALTALAQVQSTSNANLAFVLQQLNNIGATNGALTTTIQ